MGKYTVFDYTKSGKLKLTSTISNTMMFDLIRDLLLNKECISANTLDRTSLFRHFQFQSNGNNGNYSFYIKLYDKTENEPAILQIYDIKNNHYLDVNIETTNFQANFDILEKMVITSVQKRILESCVWPSKQTTEYIKEIFG